MGEGQGQAAATQPTTSAASSQANAGGVSNSGSSAANQKSPDSALELKAAAQGDSRGQDANQDASAAEQKFEREPWFAKLPPGMRKAIQAKAQGEAPRGYEERLRRYFESTN
jgi:hypothetical protein